MRLHSDTLRNSAFLRYLPLPACPYCREKLLAPILSQLIDGEKYAITGRANPAAGFPRHRSRCRINRRPRLQLPPEPRSDAKPAGCNRRVLHCRPHRQALGAARAAA